MFLAKYKVCLEEIYGKPKQADDLTERTSLDQTRATKELLAEVNRHQTDLNKLAERKNDTGSYEELKPVTLPEENTRRITTLRSEQM